MNFLFGFDSGDMTVSRVICFVSYEMWACWTFRSTVGCNCWKTNVVHFSVAVQECSFTGQSLLVGEHFQNLLCTQFVVSEISSDNMAQWHAQDKEINSSSGVIIYQIAISDRFQKRFLRTGSCTCSSLCTFVRLFLKSPHHSLTFHSLIAITDITFCLDRQNKNKLQSL